MNALLDTIGRGDLIAGLTAAVVFLGLFLLLGLTPIASVPIAVVAYVGVRLALPRPDRLAPTIRACEHQVDEISHLIQTLHAGKRSTHSDPLSQIGIALQAILAAIKSDPKKRAYADAFLDDYLTPIRAVITPYVRLASQDVTLAHADLAVTENETFPRILGELAKLREDLYRDDVTQLRTGKELVDLISLPIVTRYRDETP